MKRLLGRTHRNLQHNRRQRIEHPYYRDTGLIIHQAQLEDWRYGAGTSDRNGCGWIAVSNILQLLGDPTPPADIIRWLEEQPPLGGLSLGGYLGTYFWAVARYFKAHGYQVQVGVTPSTREKVAAWGQASAAFYVGWRGGHFVAFHPTESKVVGEPLYHFYNDRAGDLQDIRRLSDLWKDNRALYGMVIGVRSTPNMG